MEQGTRLRGRHMVQQARGTTAVVEARRSEFTSRVLAVKGEKENKRRWKEYMMLRKKEVDYVTGVSVLPTPR